MKNFLQSRWFLIALALVLISGTWAGERWRELAERRGLQDAVVAFSLFLMALPLEPRVIWRTTRRPLAPLLGVVVNSGLLPLVGWVTAKLTLSGDLHTGLLIASTTPCTVASAAVWTRKAGGNDAVATLVTLITNGFCFVVTPAWLSVFLGEQVQSAEFNFLASVWQLGKLVVLPMVGAQLLRLARPVAEFAVRRKQQLGVCTQCGILFMVLMGAIRTGMQLSSEGSGWSLAWHQLLLMVGAVVALHLSTLWLGWWLAGRFGVERGDQIAVAFAGSQKTLMIGLKVCLELQVTILPMVAFHVTQLLVDTMIADRMARGGKRADLDRPPEKA